jgi:hypothetical protein
VAFGCCNGRFGSYAAARQEGTATPTSGGVLEDAPQPHSLGGSIVLANAAAGDRRSSQGAMPKPKRERPVPVGKPIWMNFVDPRGTDWSTYFNVNFVRDDLKPLTHACAAALGMVLSSTGFVEQYPQNPTALMRRLRDMWDRERFSGGGDMGSPVAYMEDWLLLGGIYSALGAVKTFMDVYAGLITSAITPGNRMAGFNRRGSRIGARLLEWLERSATHYAGREALRATFETHLNEWLAQAIGWRDSLIHDGVMPGFQYMSVLIDREIIRLSVDDIHPAVMPDGTEVAAYARTIRERLVSLIAATVYELPGIQRPGAT